MKSNISEAAASSQVEVLRRYEEMGFRGSFAARPGQRVECFTCHQTSPASEVPLLHETRVDVLTDPADQSVVAALRCPRCSAKGTVIFAYGPTAPPDDAEVFRLLNDERGTSAR